MPGHDLARWQNEREEALVIEERKALTAEYVATGSEEAWQKLTGQREPAYRVEQPRDDVSALTTELASTRAHLAVARQQVEGYRDYLDRAQEKSARLQARINEIDAALLVAVRPIWKPERYEIPTLEERIEMLAVAVMKIAEEKRSAAS